MNAFCTPVFYEVCPVEIEKEDENMLPPREQEQWERTADEIFKVLFSILEFLKHVFLAFRDLLEFLSTYLERFYPAKEAAPSPGKQLLNSRKNFASKDSGATVLCKSQGITNPKAILSPNQEEYLILPECKEDQQYTLIVNLSEDVAVDTIVVSNHEDFSDILSSIEFQGSIEYPPEQWVQLG